MFEKRGDRCGIDAVLHVEVCLEGDGFINPFTTEARFYVLNAMAFST